MFGYPRVGVGERCASWSVGQSKTDSIDRIKSPLLHIVAGERFFYYAGADDAQVESRVDS
jgi:hypothetical protein